METINKLTQEEVNVLLKLYFDILDADFKLFDEEKELFQRLQS